MRVGNDAYRILGLPEAAQLEDFLKAFRQKVRRIHPDKQVDKPEAERAAAARKFLLASGILSYPVTPERPRAGGRVTKMEDMRSVTVTLMPWGAVQNGRALHFEPDGS